MIGTNLITLYQTESGFYPNALAVNPTLSVDGETVDYNTYFTFAQSFEVKRYFGITFSEVPAGYDTTMIITNEITSYVTDYGYSFTIDDTNENIIDFKESKLHSDTEEYTINGVDFSKPVYVVFVQRYTG